MLLLGRRRARMRPRAFGAYERFAEGKTSAQAEFISAEHFKPSGPQCAPGAYWVLGDIAEYPGMKAFFNLK